MSNLLNNPNLKKDPLDRGEDIKPKHVFTADDLKINKIEASAKESAEVSKESEQDDSVVPDRVTFYANVRINNHIKNKAEALSAIGLYKSQKDVIEGAIDYLIDSLSSDDKRRLKFQIETLEERDVRMKRK